MNHNPALAHAAPTASCTDGAAPRARSGSAAGASASWPLRIGPVPGRSTDTCGDLGSSAPPHPKPRRQDRSAEIAGRRGGGDSGCGCGEARNWFGGMCIYLRSSTETALLDRGHRRHGVWERRTCPLSTCTPQEARPLVAVSVSFRVGQQMNRCFGRTSLVARKEGCTRENTLRRAGEGRRLHDSVRSASLHFRSEFSVGKGSGVQRHSNRSGEIGWGNYGEKKEKKAPEKGAGENGKSQTRACSDRGAERLFNRGHATKMGTQERERGSERRATHAHQLSRQQRVSPPTIIACADVMTDIHPAGGRSGFAASFLCSLAGDPPFHLSVNASNVDVGVVSFASITGHGQQHNSHHRGL